MSEHVHFDGLIDEQAGVARIRLDDGQANAIQTGFLSELNAALDQVEVSNARSVILSGRPGFFSAGLDLKVLPTLDADALRAVTERFVATMGRLFLFPRPIVAAAAPQRIDHGDLTALLYLQGYSRDEFVE